MLKLLLILINILLMIYANCNTKSDNIHFKEFFCNEEDEIKKSPNSELNEFAFLKTENDTENTDEKLLNKNEDEKIMELKWHLQLIKIIWNKINHNKPQLDSSPINVRFNLKLTQHLISDISNYIKTTDPSFQSKINSHFLDALKYMEPEEIHFHEPPINWRDNVILNQALIGLCVLMLLVWLRRFDWRWLPLIFGLMAFVQKWYQRWQRESALRLYRFEHGIHQQCTKQNNNTFVMWLLRNVPWATISEKECVDHYEHVLNGGSVPWYYISVFEVLSSLFFDLLSGSSQLADVCVKMYHSLSDLPWYVAPFIMLVLVYFIFKLACSLGWGCFSVIMQPRPQQQQPLPQQQQARRTVQNSKPRRMNKQGRGKNSLTDLQRNQICQSNS